MNEEQFNERFETVEQALKFIADSQAKSEWLRKQDEAKSRARFDEIKELQAKTDLRLDRIARQLDHITQLTGFTFQELEFQNEKLTEAGNALTKKKK